MAITVLESVQALPGQLPLHFWRTKQQHEIGFVIPISNKNIIAIEAKLNADAFDPRSLLNFRQQYPKGDNLIVTWGGRVKEVSRKGLQLTIIFTK
jgi:hypothetical protein